MALLLTEIIVTTIMLLAAVLSQDEVHAKGLANIQLLFHLTLC